jgi:hypothetical protein
MKELVVSAEEAVFGRAVCERKKFDLVQGVFDREGSVSGVAAFSTS